MKNIICVWLPCNACCMCATCNFHQIIVSIYIFIYILAATIHSACFSLSLSLSLAVVCISTLIIIAAARWRAEDNSNAFLEETRDKAICDIANKWNWCVLIHFRCWCCSLSLSFARWFVFVCCLWWWSQIWIAFWWQHCGVSCLN